MTFLFYPATRFHTHSGARGICNTRDTAVSAVANTLHPLPMATKKTG